MNIDVHSKVDQEDKPLTRADVEDLLRKAGSPDKLDLSGRNLSQINLAGFNLERVNLSGTSLREANLSRANLSRANLSRANLFGANLSGANLSGDNLNGANLNGANLFGAHLNGANFSGASFFGAHLFGANLSGANLSGAYLSYANLFDANLSGTNLSGANLFGANLWEANLFDANFSGAHLSGAIGLDKLNVSPVEDTSTFRIYIIEEPLTAQNLTTILFALTELSTKCWLIAKGRFSDLIEYMQTHDVRFTEESKLIITKIKYNSPFEANFKIDLTASNVAEAIKTTIDGVIQAKQRLEKAELENKAKAQEIEQAKQKADHENKAALLEQERQELAVEKERLEILEKRLEVQKKGIEFAFEIAAKTVTMLHPNADEQTKALLIQTMLPTILQLQNGKGLELALPITLRDEEKAVESENE